MAKLLASPLFQNLFQNPSLFLFVILLVDLDPPADRPSLLIQAKLNTHSKRQAYFIEKSKALSICLAFWPSMMPSEHIFPGSGESVPMASNDASK